MATSLAGVTNAYAKDCFSDHIRESISVNSLRKPIYSKFTNGRSDKIFTELILGERLTLPVAMFYDFRAQSFQKKGTPLFCKEFKSMNKTPTFRTDHFVPLTYKYSPFDYKTVRHDILKAISIKDMEAIKLITLEAIDELKNAPDYHCMTRHFLESIYRFAYFLPKQIESARDHQLSSPLGISFEVMKLHAISLNTLAHIDDLSAPIQAEGIPILCSELPNLMDDLNEINI